MTETVPNFAQDDDEETWNILIDLLADGSSDNALPPSGSATSAAGADVPDIKHLLSYLARRVQEDWYGLGGQTNNDESHRYWTKLVKDQLLAKHGFDYSLDDVQHPSSGSNNTSSPAATPTPAVLQTEAGKNHLDAVAAILGLSPERAKQVTLGTLRSIDASINSFSSPSSIAHVSGANNGDEDGIMSLVGTPQFLVQVVMWEYKQRLARMNVVLECLRLEQDHAVPTNRREAIVEFLDLLDTTFYNVDESDKGKKIARGLFRALVTTVGRSKPQARLEALGPSRRLLSSSSSRNDGALWTDFCSHMITEQDAQYGRERVLALKTLMVLLYERLDGGIRRADYALILTAFGLGCDWFVTDNSTVARKSSSLSDLLALITAECMALWRFLENDGARVDVDDNCHPLLVGSPDCVGREMDSLIMLLSSQDQADDKFSSTVQQKSVTVLSFGLFLVLASDSHKNEEWRNRGNKFVVDANNAAFSFLEIILDCCNPLTPTKSLERTSKCDPLYEFLLEQKHPGSPMVDQNDDEIMTLENDSTEIETSMKAQRPSADTITCTSIAREVVAACISIYANSILDFGQPNNSANIEILCMIVAKIYRKNHPLIAQFWETWRVYEGMNDDSNAKKSKYPMCGLLEAAYSLAVEGYQAFSTRKVAQNVFLSSVAPFLQFLGSICDTPEVTAAIFGTIPDGLIRDVVLCCGSSSSYHRDTGGTPNERASSICAIDILLEQNSKSFINNMRNSLENGGGHITMVEGPKMLGRILRQNEDRGIVTSVLSVMSKMLYGAPQSWVLALYREFADDLVRSSMSTLVAFFTAEDFNLSQSVARLLCTFVDSIEMLVRPHDRVSENEAADFLQSLGEALLSSITFLSSSRPPVDVAVWILKGCSKYLAALHAILRSNHYIDQVLQAACMHGQGILISALSTGTSIGETVSYYATLPVSACVVAKIDAILEQSVLENGLAKANSVGIDLKATNLSSRDSAKVDQISMFLTSLQLNQHMIEEALTKSIMDLPNDVLLEAANAAIELLGKWAMYLQGSSEDPFGPENLLCSLAPAPPQIESTNIDELWRELGASNFELMSPYIARIDPASTSLRQTTATTLKLLCNILSIKSSERSKDSMIVVRMGCIDHFSSDLAKITERGIDLLHINYQSLSGEEKNDILCALLSLQLMSIATSSSVAATLAVLRLSASPGLVDTLKRTALSAANCLDSLGPDGEFDSRQKSVKMRMATACVSTLSGLWKAARWLSSAGPEGVDLAKELEGQTAFVANLAAAFCDFGCALKSETEIASSDTSLLQYLAHASDIIYSELALGDALASLDMDTVRSLTETCLCFLCRDMPLMSLGSMARMKLSFSGMVLFGVDTLVTRSMPIAEVTRLLEMLSVSVGVSPFGVGTDIEGWQIQENLISAILFLLKRLDDDKDAETRALSVPTNMANIHSTIFVTICQFLQRIDRVLGPESTPSIATLHLCFSILAHLIPLQPAVAETLIEYSAPKIALSIALRLSKSVYESQSQNLNLGNEIEDKLRVIQSVFELIFVVASRKKEFLLDCLNCKELSEAIVRNPLFVLRDREWTMPNSSKERRGYENRGGQWLEDPIWVVWIQSISIIQTMLRSACDGINSGQNQQLAQGVVSLTNEFLHVYHRPLTVCLHACCEAKHPVTGTHGAIRHLSKLNPNILREAKSIISLVAELCKRGTRDLLSSSAKTRCSEFVGVIKNVVVSIGRFLGAGARARMLFESEIIASDVDSPRPSGICVPDANYQGIIYANYSHDRSDPVTKEDLQKTMIASDLTRLSKKQEGETPFVYQCRMFVANEMTIDLERSASDCLSVALSLIWRTHPVSRSMHEIRGDGHNRVDFAALASIGAVVSFKAPAGYMPTAESSGPYQGEVAFGTILAFDTVSRQLEVSILGEGRRMVVDANWIVGVEDATARKPSTLHLDCSPESADVFSDDKQATRGLSTGVYLLILEWCHSQVSKGCSSSTNTKVFQRVKQIAEQTTVLLGADLVLHETLGDFAYLPKKEAKLLDSQVFDFFADISVLEDSVEDDRMRKNFQEGKMKEIIEERMWESIQGQIRQIVLRAWKEQLELHAASEKRRDSFSSAFRSHQFGW